VIEWAFEIVPQPIDVSCIGIGAVNLTYNGSDLTPALKDVPAVVDCDSTLYTIDGTEPITEAINAGSYRLEVELSSDDPNYELSANHLELEFAIAPMVIDLDSILAKKTYTNTNGADLRFKPFEDLDPKIKDHLIYSVVRIDINDGGFWTEVFSTSYAGDYRIAYTISVKEADRDNVIMSYHGTLLHVVSPYYEFSIQ